MVLPISSRFFYFFIYVITVLRSGLVFCLAASFAPCLFFFWRHLASSVLKPAPASNTRSARFFGRRAAHQPPIGDFLPFLLEIIGTVATGVPGHVPLHKEGGDAKLVWNDRFKAEGH